MAPGGCEGSEAQPGNRGVVRINNDYEEEHKKELEAGRSGERSVKDSEEGE